MKNYGKYSVIKTASEEKYNTELVCNYGKPTKKLQKVGTQTLIKLWGVSQR